jgi:hypothetical protein
MSDLILCYPGVIQRSAVKTKRGWHNSTYFQAMIPYNEPADNLLPGRAASGDFFPGELLHTYIILANLQLNRLNIWSANGTASRLCTINIFI